MSRSGEPVDLDDTAVTPINLEWPPSRPARHAEARP